MSAQARFPGDPGAVAEARRFTRDALATSPAAVVDRATLVVSELASNAVRHGHSGFMLTIAVAGGDVRIEVSDDSGALPVVRHPDRMEPTGRGLLIVQSLTQDWGVSPTAEGKTVWAVLSTRAPAPGPISAYG